MSLRSRSAVVPARLAILAMLTVLAGALTACGGDSDRDADKGAPKAVATAQQLQRALLAGDDLPEGFVLDTSTGESESTMRGSCFARLDQLEDDPAFNGVREERRSYDASSADGLSTVTATITAFEDLEARDHALELLLDAASGCTNVRTTDDTTGTVYDVAVSTDEDTRIDGADREVNVDLTGTVTAQGKPYRIEAHVTLSAVGRYLSKVGTLDVADSVDIGKQLVPLATTQLTRVADLP